MNFQQLFLVLNFSISKPGKKYEYSNTGIKVVLNLETEFLTIMLDVQIQNDLDSSIFKLTLLWLTYTYKICYKMYSFIIVNNKSL